MIPPCCLAGCAIGGSVRGGTPLHNTCLHMTDLANDTFDGHRGLTGSTDLMGRTPCHPGGGGGAVLFAGLPMQLTTHAGVLLMHASFCWPNEPMQTPHCNGGQRFAVSEGVIPHHHTFRCKTLPSGR